MDCISFAVHRDAYADCDLTLRERAAFEMHCASCANCRAAVERAQRLGQLLRAELPALAAATPMEQTSLRDNVLRQFDAPGDARLRAWSLPLLRLAGTGAVLALALLLALTFLPGDEQTVSAAEIVDRAWAAVEGRQSMSGVLYWEAEWSQRLPRGEQITRTFEIVFDLNQSSRYRITYRDPAGRVYQEMVRDGANRMWQLSRTMLSDGSERVQVDEIILSPQEMQELASWYVPSPFLDDLNRFTEILDSVELLGQVDVAGRPAYVLRGRLFGLGWPGPGARIDPVTSTLRLVVDAETYWLLDRVEKAPSLEGEGNVAVGFVQRTLRFEILSPSQAPPDAFDFAPPPGAEVRTVQGIPGYYAPSDDAIGLDEAAALTSFSLVLPTNPPDDLKPRPSFHYTGTGQAGELAGVFSIVYLGQPGRQAFLIEHEHALPLGRAARLVMVGEKQGWLVPDPIDGHKFSLHLIEPQPEIGPDGRPWPRSIELQVWGLSLDEAVAMLASLEPY